VDTLRALAQGELSTIAVDLRYAEL
jgi:hypothetical protein